MSNKDLRVGKPTFTEEQLLERIALGSAFEHMQTAMDCVAKAFRLTFPHMPKLALPNGQTSKFALVAQTADQCGTLILQMQIQCGIRKPAEVLQGPGAAPVSPEAKPEPETKTDNPPSEPPKPSLVLPE